MPAPFYNNTYNFKKLHSFLASSDKQVLLVVSPSGCGKTTFCQMGFASFPHYEIVRPYYELYNSHKDFVTHIERQLQHKHNLLLFFDDIDVLLINNRSAQAYVCHLIASLKKTDTDVKIVMTCTKHDEKKILEFRKKIDIIYLHPPTLEHCLDFLQKHVVGKNVDKDVLRRFVLNFGCNIQAILSNLRFCGMTGNYSDHTILGMNIYDTCHRLLVDKRDISENMKDVYLSTDPTLITYTLYDNHRPFFEKEYALSMKQLVCLYAFVTDVYVHTAVMESMLQNVCSRSVWFDHNILRLDAIRHAHDRIRDASRSCASSSHKIHYTAINSRSTQHFNNLKKLQRFTSTFQLSRQNAFLACELLHQKKAYHPRQFPDDINIVQPYINNICTSDIDPYAKALRICCGG